MKIAIAHDWLTGVGGAEKVVMNFKEIYTNAPIYTTVYAEEMVDEALKNIDVRTTFIQKYKKAKTNHQKYFPFMPFAWEQFDFNEYDIVLSSSTSCAKGIITPPDTMHICYCNSPMRYAWEFYYEHFKAEKLGLFKKKLLPLLINYMRIWDVVSANRVDFFIANSTNVAKRIWKHYRRHSDVIHPPVKSKLFNINNIDDEYFLIVSRLVPYKKTDLAIQVFNELKLPLVIIGTGRQLDYLKSIANDNITILGYQPDGVIADYYSKCRALIFPAEEDFGITPLEAQASGRPVIAYGEGGVLETVINEKTGIFFSNQNEKSLKDAVLDFNKMHFDKKEIREYALTFDEEIFKNKIKKYVEQKYNEFNKNNTSVGTVI